MLLKLLHKLALVLLGVGCLGWGVVDLGQGLWGSYLKLYGQLGQTSLSPKEYLRACAQSDPCLRKAAVLVWGGLGRDAKRQAFGLMVAGVGTLVFVGLSRKVSKTTERRSFDPTYKRI